MASLLSDMKTVHISSLRYHPDNARRGNVEAIANSLHVNGQFSPVVVQLSTNYILAGNHTVKAAAQLGWSSIDAVYVDVDDRTAKKIMLAANRTADLGEYDNDALLAVLEELDGDLLGTGYTDIDLEVLRHGADDEPELEPEDDPVPNFVVYGAVIQCGTLEDQRSLLAKLSELGFDARPLKRD